MLRLGNFSELPEEIQFDILSRVPAKSIGLCRCVSKSWRAMFSKPSFIKTHLQMSKINLLESLVITGFPVGTTFYSAPLNNAHRLLDEINLSLTKLSFDGYIRIHGSCDGMLLVSNIQDKTFVINPLTREIRQVPPLPIARAHFPYFCWYVLCYGLGYDSVRVDYKIIVISYFCTWDLDGIVTQENSVGVYSLKTGSWKILGKCPYNCFVFGSPINQSVFIGGCLYWLARRSIDNKPVIMAFSLVDEKFLEIPPPGLILDDLENDHYALVVHGGCLCMYSFEYYQVWVMKKYGVLESWTKLSQLTMDNYHGWFDCFLNAQEQVVMYSVVHGLVMLNSKQGTSKKIVLNRFKGHTPRVEASFVESLISPHGSNY